MDLSSVRRPMSKSKHAEFCDANVIEVVDQQRCENTGTLVYNDAVIGVATPSLFVGLTVYSLDRKAVEGRCLLGARILLEMRRRTRSAKIRTDRDLSTPDIQ